jgi:hypothetical protein
MSKLNTAGKFKAGNGLEQRGHCFWSIDMIVAGDFPQLPPTIGDELTSLYSKHIVTTGSAM